MRRLLALVVILATAWLVREAVGDDGTRTTALALGFALIAAALTGDLLERVHLPRVTGYLLFGMICGPYLLNLISRPMARELNLINELAIALIAFVAGLELNYSRLRPRIAAFLRVGIVLLSVATLTLFALLWAAWPWLPIWPEAAGWSRIAAAALVAIVVVGFSPTVTIAVIADARARGPLSELVVSVVVLSDLILIVVFTLLMQFARWAFGESSATDVGLLAQLSWEIFGAMAFGAIVGSVFALYLRSVGRELTLVLIGMCVLLSAAGHLLHFEALLAALAAGLVVENIAPPRGDRLKEAVERGSLPVLVIFFAAAGASLHLDALATVGLVAVAISLVRLVVVAGSLKLGLRTAGLTEPYTGYAWMGFMSKAGVSLGLTILVANAFPAWGVAAQTLLVALIALHELAGPVLFKTALTRAGEVGKAN
ncbi:MAG: cation:proton antiporter [Vicinamibacteraceae bacterium]|nr:cation:proton antiporter [Vicinamibacteraceae bacterium]